MAAEKTYTVVRPAGPWAAGDEVAADDFEKHPFKDKFLGSGAVVKTSQRRSDNAERDAARIAELQQQIAQAQAELDALQGTPTEPTAPAQVAYDINPEDQPSTQEAADTRAAGNEVIQPQPGDPRLGEVKPGEATEEGQKATKARK